MLPSSAYTFAPGAMPASSRLLIRRSTPRFGCAASYGPSWRVGVAFVSGVVHDEVDAGKRGGGGTDVPGRRRVDGLVGDRPAQPLVRGDDPRAERVDPFEKRKADLVVVEEPAPGRRALRRRAVQRVDLPARRIELCAPLVHGVELVRAEVGMDDRVREHTARARVAVDDIAHGRDLEVGEHVGVGRPRRRREQRDRGLGCAEHERGPSRAVDDAGIDVTGPAIRIGHAQEATERGGARADPARGIDEMGLHVDDGCKTTERFVGRLAFEHGAFGNVEESAAVRVVDRPQRCRGAAAVGRVCGARQL